LLVRVSGNEKTKTRTCGAGIKRRFDAPQSGMCVANPSLSAKSLFKEGFLCSINWNS